MRKPKSLKYARELKLVNHDFKIDVLYEYDKKKKKYRMFTDDLKYGNHLEIIFDKNKQCFTIKNLEKFREEWKKTHPKQKIQDNLLEKFVKEVK